MKQGSRRDMNSPAVLRWRASGRVSSPLCKSPVMLAGLSDGPLSREDTMRILFPCNRCRCKFCITMRRIQSKLLAGFVCIIVIVAVQALMAYLSSARVERLLEQAYRSSAAEIFAGEQIRHAGEQIRHALSDPRYLPGAADRTYIAQELTTLGQAIQDAKLATRNSLEAAQRLDVVDRVRSEARDLDLLKGIEEGFDQLNREWAALAGLDLTVSSSTRFQDLLGERLLKPAKDYQSRSMSDIEAEGSLAAKIVRESRLWLSATAIASLLVAGAVGILIARSVIGPLRRMTREANAISKGSFSRRLSVAGNDEFGQLGDSFNRVLDALQAVSISREDLEARISERTAELDRFFTLSLDMLCIADFSGRFLRVNSAFVDTLGYPLEEYVSKPFSSFIHPDDRAATEAEMNKYRQVGDPSIHFENRYRHQDGTWRTLSWNAVPLKEVGLIYAVAHDITELRRIEQALRSREEELQTALAFQKQAQQAERERASRMLQYQQALLRLRDLKRTELDAFINETTEECARQLAVDRVGVWFLNPEETELQCRDLFQLSRLTHTSGTVISHEKYPVYFRAIRGLAPIVADDAALHPSTRDFGVSYLRPLNIMSMLDVPIRVGEKLVGVLCCEHVGSVRKWAGEEIEFVSGIASALMLGVEQHERLLAEEKLRASEEYNRSIVESSEDCVKVLDLDGRLLDMAENGRRLMEVDDFEAISGQDWLRLWVGDDHSSAGLAVTAAREGRIGRFQGFCPTFKGVPKWWDVMVSPVHGADGQPSRLLAVSRDITAQREVEEEVRRLNATLEDRILRRTAELRGSEERFRLMVEQVQDYAIFLLSADGIVATWNVGAQRAKGYTSEEIIGRHFSCFHSPDDVRAGLPGRLLTEAISRNVAHHEGWCMRKDGSRFWAEVTITAIRDENGVLRGFSKVTHDLTEHRNAELALTEALEVQRDLTRKAQAGEKARSEFLAIMSHEVRTPMNGIIGYADLLSNSPGITGENRQYCNILLQSGQSLLRILDDILDFSSLEAGSLKIERTAFSPRQLVEDVRLLMSPAAARKGIVFLAEVSPAVPETLVSDPGRLRQVLINLGGNAIKFTDRGEVTIRLAPAASGEPDLWDFSVEDTGPGLTEDQQEKIFKPFVQVDASSSRRYGGTGLGLAISRRLAELMGGSLVVESHLNEGASFLARLPMTSGGIRKMEVAPTAAAHDGDFASRHPLKILVAEDDLINLKLTLTLLRKLGYSAISAKNGREAVERFSRDLPTCIIMDLQMPEMDGIEATIAIREMERSCGSVPIHILAFTANTDAGDRQRCLDAGMSAHVNKPVRRERLCELLAQASQSLASIRS